MILKNPACKLEVFQNLINFNESYNTYSRVEL